MLLELLGVIGRLRLRFSEGPLFFRLEPAAPSLVGGHRRVYYYYVAGDETYVASTAVYRLESGSMESPGPDGDMGDGSERPGKAQRAYLPKFGITVSAEIVVLCPWIDESGTRGGPATHAHTLSD